jgi:hypothetical protein
MKNHWMKFSPALAALGIWATFPIGAAEPAVTLTVQADQPGAKISPSKRSR